MSEFQRRLERRDDMIVRRYDDGEEWRLVADFGPGTAGHVDVIDDTLIVVVGDEQREFELPHGKARASMTNGVVTVEMTEEDT